MAKYKFLNSIEKMTMGKLSPATLEKIAATVNDEVAKRKTYIKVPNVKGLTAEQAGKTVASMGFEYSQILAVPSARWATKNANEVVMVRPHAGLVLSPDTQIKIYYTDQAIIEKSKQMAVDQAESKAKHKAQRENVAQEVDNFSKKITKKLNFKKKK